MNGLTKANRKRIALLRIKLQPFFLLALLACGDGTYDPPDGPDIPPVVAI